MVLNRPELPINCVLKRFTFFFMLLVLVAPAIIRIKLIDCVCGVAVARLVESDRCTSYIADICEQVPISNGDCSEVSLDILDGNGSYFFIWRNWHKELQ